MAHIVLLALSALCMLLLPVFAGALATRRLGVPWGLFLAGALTFFASQVVHLPLNSGVAMLFTLGIVPAPPPAAVAWLLPIALGLSAGLCEETARYVVLRWWLKQARAWRHGVVFGLGHGGFESMIVGVFAIIGLMNLVALQDADLTALDLPAEKIPVVQAQLDAFWGMPAWQVPIGAVERVLAMCCHLGFTVLVLRGVTSGQMRWVAAAVLAHAALDAGAVALAPYGVLAAEGFVALGAAAALATVFLLRDPPAAAAESIAAVVPIALQRVSMEDAARALDDP